MHRAGRLDVDRDILDVATLFAQTALNLVSHSVPSEAIIVEPEAATTAQSTTAAAEIMHRMGLVSCLLVSDGYHIFRAKKMLADQGLNVYGSPRPAPADEGARLRWLYLRQSVGYLLWEVGIRL